MYYLGIKNYYYLNIILRVLLPLCHIRNFKTPINNNIEIKIKQKMCIFFSIILYTVPIRYMFNAL